MAKTEFTGCCDIIFMPLFITGFEDTLNLETFNSFVLVESLAIRPEISNFSEFNFK